jgi:hypothetical protein
VEEEKSVKWWEYFECRGGEATRNLTAVEPMAKFAKAFAAEICDAEAALERLRAVRPSKRIFPETHIADGTSALNHWEDSRGRNAAREGDKEANGPQGK